MSMTFPFRCYPPLQFALLFITALVFSHCGTPKRISVPSQGDRPFAEQWRAADSLHQLGLYKSALPLVQELFNLSVAQNEPGSAARAMKRTLRYRQILSEDYEAELWPSLEAAIASAAPPTRNMLQAFAAKTLWDYYNAHQWQIANRQTAGGVRDIREWSGEQFNARVTALFDAALADRKVLFDAGWEKAAMALEERASECAPGTTLLDLIANQAIPVYLDQRLNVQALEQLLPNPGLLLAPNDEFMAAEVADSPEALWYEVIDLFQDMTRLHTSRGTEPALVATTVLRLKTFMRLGLVSGSNHKYISTLRSLEDSLTQPLAQAQLAWVKAQYYEEKGGQRVDPALAEHRWYLLRAEEECERLLAMAACPEDIRKASQAMLSRIRTRGLNAVCERVVLPREPWRSVVHHRNLDACYYTVIPFDYRDYLDIRAIQGHQEQVSAIMSKAMLRGFGNQLLLDNGGDRREHTLEISHDPLESGFYLLLMSPRQSVVLDSTQVVINPFWVSDIAWVQRQDNQRRNEFRFVHRKTGQPLANLVVQLVNQTYNQYRRRMELQPGQSMRTGQDGKLTIPQSDGSQRFVLRVQNGEDSFWVDQSFYQGIPGPERPPYTRTHFFTDRKVYRPGQTVHFKGLAVKYDGEARDIHAGLKETVFLYDANAQQVDKLTLTTNEYGSYHGSFHLPREGLTGPYRIETGRGSHYFNVEEYKRPTFKVSLTGPDKAITINEKVRVTGKSEALAGFPLAGAEVKYRVTRVLEQPFWYRRGGFPQGPEQEIAAGSTATAPNGGFEISFQAVGNPLQSNFEQYRYTAYVEIVDISGETQTASWQIRIRQAPFFLMFDLPETAQPKDLQDSRVFALDPKGDSIAVSGRATLYRIELPEAPQRERPWALPDSISLDSAAFHRRFPNDAFRNNVARENASVKERLSTVAFNTGDTGQLEWGDVAHLQTGWYMVRLVAASPRGDSIVTEHRFTLFRPSEDDILPEFLWTHMESSTAEPGEKLALWLSTTTKSPVFVETEVGGVITGQEVLRQGGRSRVDIPVTEACRGNFGIHISMVHENRLYNESYTVEVPYSNKKLDVRLNTIRDQLEPGSAEKWTVSVKGPAGKPFSAELLAGMYDASLDFLGFANDWVLNPYTRRPIRLGWQQAGSFSRDQGWQFEQGWNKVLSHSTKPSCELDFGTSAVPRMGVALEMDAAKEGTLLANLTSTQPVQEPTAETDTRVKGKPEAIALRTDFSETAFFYPSLETAEDGSVAFSFTLPQSLTTWKWMLLAHGKDLQTGRATGEVVASKPLMVLANPPRFFRKGDTLSWAAQVINKSDQQITASVELTLNDLKSGEPLTGKLIQSPALHEVTLEKGATQLVRWQLAIGDLTEGIVVKTTATGSKFSDAERRVLPVLPRKTLVTETLPVAIFGRSERTFELDKLLQSADKGNLQNHRLTLEVSANPAWYIVQSLPFLMDTPDESTEQAFARFYGNALATHIANQQPAIVEMIGQFANASDESLVSKLLKNQELKELLITETPWVTTSMSQTDDMLRLKQLLDPDAVKRSLDDALDKLIQNQLPNGAWPWFKGMRPNRYVTQYITTGIARLQYLDVERSKTPEVQDMVNSALAYLDQAFVETCHRQEQAGKVLLSHQAIQYLYLRSFFPDRDTGKQLDKALQKYWELAQMEWVELGLTEQAYLALAAHRYGKKELSDAVRQSLEERALFDTRLGRYWKTSSAMGPTRGKMATHTVLMELFRETGADAKLTEEMKQWLLAQKRVQHWPTTTATADACYALLSDGMNWLDVKENPDISLGEYEIAYKEGPTGDNRVYVNPEPGTGHFKTAWDSGQIKPEMGLIKVKNNHDGPLWGGVYWQFFQDMDEVEASATELSIVRKYFVERTTSGKTQRVALEQGAVAPGEKIVVRIELESIRDMEFVHLSVKRPAGFEPVEVRSGYRREGGLGHYLSIRDAAHHLFFDHLPSGKHVIEYELRANVVGVFSDGPCTVQCMYAPEFTARSAGKRLQVK